MQLKMMAVRFAEWVGWLNTVDRALILNYRLSEYAERAYQESASPTCNARGLWAMWRRPVSRVMALLRRLSRSIQPEYKVDLNAVNLLLQLTSVPIEYGVIQVGNVFAVRQPNQRRVLLIQVSLSLQELVTAKPSVLHNDRLLLDLIDSDAAHVVGIIGESPLLGREVVFHNTTDTANHHEHREGPPYFGSTPRWR